jgi:mannosyl-3-phosphoglycerate phosphatase
MKPKLIIFTDLDGTLLDSKYSFKHALPALSLLKKKNIPLILCSSKTKIEIEHYRKKLKNLHPFISENGGGVYVPKKYFSFKIPNNKYQINNLKNYTLITFGVAYADLRNALKDLRSKGFDVKGFGDMGSREISRLTGLKTSEATMAKQRYFDEVFAFRGDEQSLKKLKRQIKLKGLNFTQGILFHIMGNSDKGRAVEILKNLYRRPFGKIATVALGDSPNDLEMFREVDYPMVVRRSDGSYDRSLRVKGLIRIDGIGPEGWNRAVIKTITQMMKK